MDLAAQTLTALALCDMSGVRVREAGGALLRRQPRHGHQGPRESLPPRQGQGGYPSVPLPAALGDNRPEHILIVAFLVWFTGETGSLSAGERVPAHDTAGWWVLFLFFWFSICSQVKRC
jgi:hypothetical protein